MRGVERLERGRERDADGHSAGRRRRKPRRATPSSGHSGSSVMLSFAAAPAWRELRKT